MLLPYLRDENPFAPGVAAVGLGRWTVMQLKIELGKALPLLLEQHGIPQDATVIDIFITPMRSADGADLLPALGLQRLHARDLPHSMTLHPVPFALESDAELEGAGSLANVMVIWLPPPAEPEVESLHTAARAFATGDHRGSIVPAQIAVEAKLNQVLTTYFARFAGDAHVRSFLTDGATYGHQLRFLLPALFSSAGAPALPESVMSHLQALRSKRNRVGHEHAPVQRSEAAPMLLAALFAYRYLLTYGPLLDQPGSA